MILRSKTRAEVQQGFRGTDEQISFGRQTLGKAEEQIAPLRRIEVDRDVSAEDDVEGADAGEWLQQVSLLKRTIARIWSLILQPPFCSTKYLDEILRFHAARGFRAWHTIPRWRLLMAASEMSVARMLMSQERMSGIVSQSMMPML